jgi:Sensors of blue-light using FAD
VEAAPNNTMIFQLLYRSRAIRDFWPDDLFELVEKSRRKNAERDLTGMLLFHQGYFLQLLEGPEQAVRGCFARVEADPRHDSVSILLEGTSAERDFPEWTMGFQRPDEGWILPRAWSTILEHGFVSEVAFEQASSAKELLTSFHSISSAAANKESEKGAELPIDSQ